MKEEDRLSAIVTAITQESQILPRGSFIRRFEDGQIIVNPNFKGLDVEEGKQFRNYFHLRAPVFPWNTNVVTAQKVNTQLDCLDSIDVDFPPGKIRLTMLLSPFNRCLYNTPRTNRIWS